MLKESEIGDCNGGGGVGGMMTGKGEGKGSE